MAIQNASQLSRKIRLPTFSFLRRKKSPEEILKKVKLILLKKSIQPKVKLTTPILTMW
ncbi:MAG: hypothetical protein ACXAD7_03360 [Candidatus Kariarchaeaceae archaeon]|jgi:hypothetical protein